MLPAFPVAPSWRFINAELPITESLSNLDQYGGYDALQNISLDLNSMDREVNFIGIKTGDVNFTASLYDCGEINGLIGDGGEFEMVIKDVDVKSDGHELTFDLKSTVNRTGFQAGIGFDISKLEYEYLTVISELEEFEEENEFATHLAPEGKLNFLWVTPDGYAKPVNPELKDIKVKFKSLLTAEELLAELLLTEGERSSENTSGVNSLIYMRNDFKNVAYDSDGNETPIRMTIAPEVIAKLSTRKEDIRFAPNPFDEYTRLMINPEITSNATITIYNQLGAVVLNKRIPDSGMMHIQTQNNWAEGVYYYTVESLHATYTGKLIKL